MKITTRETAKKLKEKDVRKKRVLRWKNNGVNQFLEGKEFYISYNNGNSLFSLIPETALVKCLKNGGKRFYILDGDWRKEYVKIVSKGWKKCKEFFDNNKEENQSFWSN